jgi:hypothetical protein
MANLVARDSREKDERAPGKKAVPQRSGPRDES